MVSRSTAISAGASVSASRKVIRSTAISAGALVAATTYVSGGGVAPDGNRKNLRSFFPHVSVPVVSDDGTMSGRWYSFFDNLINVQLATQQAALTTQDIVNQLNTVVTKLNEAVSSLALTDAQSRANATALQTVVEVTKNATLPGSAQIPPVVVYKNALIESPGGGGD